MGGWGVGGWRVGVAPTLQINPYRFEPNLTAEYTVYQEIFDVKLFLHWQSFTVEN